MSLVVDAGVVTAALVDAGELGRWAAERLRAGPLYAPHLLPVETSHALRRAVLAGDLTAEVATLAHRDLVDLRVHLVPYAPFAERVWELRDSVSAYDAWYVALAEALGAPLATLDLRLRRAHGPQCAFVVP